MAPYVVYSPIFKLSEKAPGVLFHNAEEPVIVHGSLKRLMPHTGEVAITYDNGHLRIFSAGTDNKVFVIFFFFVILLLVFILYLLYIYFFHLFFIHF